MSGTWYWEIYMVVLGSIVVMKVNGILTRQDVVRFSFAAILE